jgi:inositol transport system ATP-binding protein
MKICAGVFAPSRGTIRVRGREVHLPSPLAAMQMGIAMIHQELNLMPFMTVAENIWIRREPLSRFGLVDHGELNRRTRALFQRLRIDIDPEEQVEDLTIANRQMVEIAKAVSYDTDILIMDEPTSALAEREVAHLFDIIRDLRAAGKGIVYITHKMSEVFEIADEVSVFRDGRHVASDLASNLDRDQLIRLMVGRELTQMFPKTVAEKREVVLAASGLTREGVFHDVSFELHGGEILGIAGLVGSGRTSVAETLFGVQPATSGTIHIAGEQVRVSSPVVAMRQGMALLTEDRKQTGLFLLLTVSDNMEVAVLRDDYTRAGFVKRGLLMALCERMRASLRVKTPDLAECVQNLSGGNQQKALIARWLMTKPRILILDEPTRGIDVGAKAEIYRLISDLATQGVAIILISSEMPEILGMSDRIMVMHEGRVTGFLDRAEADQVKIMHLASG